jgi:SAM-dependent methyltransferase
VNIPKSCIEQIQKQRTQFANVRDPRKDWERSIRREFEYVATYLPHGRIGAIADIGCGLAGIDVMLYQAIPGLRLYLVDIDRMEPRPGYGYTDTPSAYCRYGETLAFLAANDIPAPCVSIAPNLDHAPDNGLDLVLSTISWGFHYPLAIHLPQVAVKLRPGGRIIVDLRTANAETETAALLSIGGRILLSERRSERQTRVVFERDTK